MDSSAVNWNVTIDDFDSILDYADQGVWSTPDPSASDFDASKSPWLRGTYHETTTKGASLKFSITGPALYIYGATGPKYGSFEIQIDHYTGVFSAYSAQAANKPQVLYAANNLTYGRHAITLTNVGALPDLGVDKGGDGFLLDYIHTTIQVAPAGATATNQTFEETAPDLKYSGDWGNNTGPVFSGGGTAYTNGDGASVSLSFKGSAIYVLGDKKNDHRGYSVVLDGAAPEEFNGTSGCGGAWGLTCEQQVPTIKYLASNLDDSQHTITVTNHPGVNNSYFDLDSIVVVVPSVYKPRTLNTTSVFVDGTSGGGGNTGGGNTGGGNTGGGGGNTGGGNTGGGNTGGGNTGGGNTGGTGGGNTGGGNGNNSGGNTGAGAMNHAPGMMSLWVLIFTLLFALRSLRRS